MAHKGLNIDTVISDELLHATVGLLIMCFLQMFYFW